MFNASRKSFVFRLILSVVNLSFILSLIAPTPAMAAGIADLGLPKPGSMLSLSESYVPVIAKGLKVHPDNPILFDFIIDTGNTGLKSTDEALKKESERVIKYFLASLTTNEADLWVNLSPYEKDRTIPESLGATELGRDMLAQDYILKQLTASLIYPEKELGREFWGKVYAKAQAEYGSSEIPVNTFNKVWIVADRAKVYVKDNTAFVVSSHLKVMLEEDYLSMAKHEQTGVAKSTNNVGSQIVREVVLPELEREVNAGKNFANLRQIFNSMILATWYKNNLKEALLNQVYANKNKVVGVDVTDKTIKEQIYKEYLKAYKKGVFNYIKEDVNVKGERTPKKYFSGGVLGRMDLAMTSDPSDADVRRFSSQGQLVSVSVKTQDAAMVVDEEAWEASWGIWGKMSALVRDARPSQRQAASNLIRWAKGEIKEKDIPVASRKILTESFGGFSQKLQDVIALNFNAESDQAMSAVAAANFKTLSKVRPSWDEHGLTKMLVDLLSATMSPQMPFFGLVTSQTRELVRFAQKADIHKELQAIIEGLLKNRDEIGRLIVDQKEVGVKNPGADIVVEARSLDNLQNLIIGKATGTHITVYKRDNDRLNILTNISIQWGSDTRVVISTDAGVFDYRLSEEGQLQPISKEGIQMTFNGSYISLGGNTALWPKAMKDFVRERLNTISTKERHSSSNVVDAYFMMSKGGLMTGWVTRSEARAIAQQMVKANGAAMLQTAEGLQDVMDIPLMEDDLLKDTQVYIYAGAKNLVRAAEDYINSRGDVDQGIEKTIEAQDNSADSITFKESLEAYLVSRLRFSLKRYLRERDTRYLQERVRTNIKTVVRALLNDISLEAVEDHSNEERIIEDLQRELKGDEKNIIFRKNGRLYVHSLQWILKNMPNPERPVGENVSGDQQKLLDFVFNQLLKYVMRLEVHAIISEEDSGVIYGSGASSAITDGYRVIAFLDPVDGSSQIKEGGTFGSIITYGYLRPGQSIEDGSFVPREQILTSFDISFGPNTTLTLTNHFNPQGEAEVAQFALTRTDTGREDFRLELIIKRMLDKEVDGLEWEGLVPKASAESVLLLARGGSVEKAKVAGHRQFVEALESRFGVVPIYSGALASEMKHIMLANDLSGPKVVGAMYFYAENKLRQAFEGIHYASTAAIAGAEVIDGEQPLMNLPLSATEATTLSGRAMPYYGGSSWMTKLRMSWSYHIQRYMVSAQIPLTTENLNAQWVIFFDNYVKRTERVITEVAALTSRSEQEVRKALLAYDSRNMMDQYFPLILESDARVIAQRLFVDAAMSSSPADAARETIRRLLERLNLGTDYSALTARQDGSAIIIDVRQKLDVAMYLQRHLTQAVLQEAFGDSNVSVAVLGKTLSVTLTPKDSAMMSLDPQDVIVLTRAANEVLGLLVSPQGDAANIRAYASQALANAGPTYLDANTALELIQLVFTLPEAATWLQLKRTSLSPQGAKLYPRGYQLNAGDLGQKFAALVSQAGQRAAAYQLPSSARTFHQLVRHFGESVTYFPSGILGGLHGEVIAWGENNASGLVLSPIGQVFYVENGFPIDVTYGNTLIFQGLLYTNFPDQETRIFGAHTNTGPFVFNWAQPMQDAARAFTTGEYQIVSGDAAMMGDGSSRLVFAAVLMAGGLWYMSNGLGDLQYRSYVEKTLVPLLSTQRDMPASYVLVKGDINEVAKETGVAPDMLRRDNEGVIGDERAGGYLIVRQNKDNSMTSSILKKMSQQALPDEAMSAEAVKKTYVIAGYQMPISSVLVNGRTRHFIPGLMNEDRNLWIVPRPIGGITFEEDGDRRQDQPEMIVERFIASLGAQAQEAFARAKEKVIKDKARQWQTLKRLAAEMAEARTTRVSVDVDDPIVKGHVRRLEEVMQAGRVLSFTAYDSKAVHMSSDEEMGLARPADTPQRLFVWQDGDTSNVQRIVSLWFDDLSRLPEFAGITTSDQAQAASPLGGIDLDSKNLILDVNGDKINISFDPAMLEQFRRGDFSGVRPVIISIVPVANINGLLGRQDTRYKEALATV